MSRKPESPKLELKLEVSPPSPRTNPPQVESPNTSISSRLESSCVLSPEAENESIRYPGSPKETSMVLVGCPRCLMYVLLSEVDPKCPRCQSTVLLGFLNKESHKRTRN